MHKLQNGSQVQVRPPRKPLVGLGGYFSESNEQGAPSYPGQDWFNDCTDEFFNALAAAGIEYDHERLDHLARAFAAVRSQEWNANANYGIGQEVVRNGLRYIARAASGPDSSGAVIPDSNNGTVWDLVLPSGSSISGEDASGKWIQIAEVFGSDNTRGDSISIEIIGGSSVSVLSRYRAEVTMSERSDSIATQAILKSSSGSSDPKIYTKYISPNRYALWLHISASVASPLTIISKARVRYRETKVGVLGVSNSGPVSPLLVSFDTGYQFASIPIGMEVAFDTPPPTNDPRFRFVKLTYNDAYNTGLLTSQTLSGSAPELVSTAVISAAQSPINGQTINMINTMGTFIRPGVTAGVLKASQNKSHTHDVPQGGTAGVGVYLQRATSFAGTYTQSIASGEDESNPYCLSAVFYKRIY
ncbi:hypothetical protein ACOCGT_001149 [Vibrio cholerae]